jgi:hypothetical protein
MSRNSALVLALALGSLIVPAQAVAQLTPPAGSAGSKAKRGSFVPVRFALYELKFSGVDGSREPRTVSLRSREVHVGAFLVQSGRHALHSSPVSSSSDSTSYARSPMPAAKVRAVNILSEFVQAQNELVGRAVVLTDAKAGTVESVWLDEVHGLRISVRGHHGKWPVATIKFMQKG